MIGTDDYTDLEQLYLDSVFTEDEQDAIRQSHASGGLTAEEIDERLSTAPTILTEIEDYIENDTEPYIDELGEYTDWLFRDAREPPHTSYHDREKLIAVTEHLPEIATYFDDQFHPYQYARALQEDDNESGLYDDHRQKAAEYLIRTEDLWDKTIRHHQIVETIMETAPDEDDLASQYLPQFLDFLPDDAELLEEAVYPAAMEGDEARTRSMATTPLETLAARLPDDYVRENEDQVDDEAWDEAIELEGIQPRLRGIQFAGACSNLEPRHWRTLLADQPTGDTVLLTIEDELIGSWKYDGARSILALQDVKQDGRYTLQKGYTYESTHDLWEQREEATDHEGWSVLEVEELPINPLRRAGQDGERSPEQFRQRIDERRDQLEDLIL